jgi:AcrR family transcriptional regulator
MPAGKGPPPDLKQACIAEARRIIDEDGLDRLSLREVARKLGVSHQAPYKHFPSRDHILAAVVAEAYADFARYLDGGRKTGNAVADLHDLGVRYLTYATRNPLNYRLMFNTRLPDPGDHPEIFARSRAAFEILLRRLAAAHQERGHGSVDVETDAIFVWTALHGLASAVQSDAMRIATPGRKATGELYEQVLARVGTALDLLHG